MTKQNNTASALAGILNARRGGDRPAESSIAIHTEPEPATTPSPALPPSPARVRAAKVETPVSQTPAGKSSDPDFRQCSIYIRKTTRKKVGRALDDDDAGQDFSDLVEELLEKWLASRT